jgi:hypothetical protein
MPKNIADWRRKILSSEGKRAVTKYTRRTTMLKRFVITTGLAMALIFVVSAKPASAQDSTSKTAPEAAVGHAYRLDFTVFELEDGKKLNSRQYSMNMNSFEQNTIKIGTRVPVTVKGDEYQYIDVGTNIWCRLRDRKDVSWLNDDVMLNTKMEISTIANSEQQEPSTRPAIRQMAIEASTIATLGKSMTVGTVDDPNSRRQFQLDVTVTKLK